MKQRKHKRKESFSILLISNTGLSNKQIHITRSILRGFFVFILLICVVCGWLAYQYWSGYQNGARRMGVKGQSDASSEELLEKLASQEELVKQLEAEKTELNDKNNALTTENKALLEAAKTSMGVGNEDGVQAGEEAEPDVIVPGLYPYVSINTQNAGNVIASGDGTVVSVGSDDTYPLIIEIEHESGYKTRYMFLQEAESLQAEGAQVQAGDILATLGANNIQLDYQVIHEGEPIDPLDVFEAKG